MAGVLSASSCGAPAPKIRRLARETSPFWLALLEDLGGEDANARQYVYLLTISRVLLGVAASVGYRDLSTLTNV